MKKWIALFFLSLICLATLPGAAAFAVKGYAAVAECDKGELKCKEGGKELKEALVCLPNRTGSISVLSQPYPSCGHLTLPQPHMEQITPPPNGTC